MDLNKRGILQIDNERMILQPRTLDFEYGCNPVLTAEIMNFFERSNMIAKKLSDYDRPGIERVIFNDPATIVMWTDGSKTIVKCQPGDTYDAEKGLALCISKKYFGNKGNFNEVFKKWIPEEKEISVDEMRNKLTEFCHQHSCLKGCKLYMPCECGRGKYFTQKPNERAYMTDNEIRDAYKIVFEK
jgi:hypothetical protein